MISLARLIFRESSRKYKKEMAVQQCEFLVRASRNIAQRNYKSDVTGVVFSMDRAMQLHALLGSYRDNVANGPKLTIIYRVTSESHEKAYQGVLDEFSDLILLPIRQQNRESFQHILIDVLTRVETKNVFFLVDDNMFIEPMDLGALAAHASAFSIPTFRLGKNLNKSYTQQKSQSKPDLQEYKRQSDIEISSTDMFSWCWSGGELDWGYPLSVDGHIFQRHEVLAMAESIVFDSPNTFEGNLQKFNAAYQWRAGICFRKSRLINIPYNKVQTDFKNIHGEMHQDEMLLLWNEGNRIDRASYYGLVNVSAHQEIPLMLVKLGSK